MANDFPGMEQERTGTRQKERKTLEDRERKQKGRSDLKNLRVGNTVCYSESGGDPNLWNTL